MAETVTRSLESTDLRSQLAGQFHPVEVEESFIAANKIFKDSADTLPAEDFADAEALCFVVRHPNGERELVYEYFDTLLRYERQEMFNISPGDTIWLADWEDIHKPVLTPGDRDYHICTSESEARVTEPRKNRLDLSIFVLTAAMTVVICVGFFLVLIGLNSESIQTLATLSAITLGLFAGAYKANDYIFDRIPSPHDDALSALSSPVEAVQDLDTEEYDTSDLMERCKEITATLADWEKLTVSDVSVEDGTIECFHPRLTESVTLSFRSPRKWDEEKYDMVALTEQKGVGSAEQLVGESLYVTADTRDTVKGIVDASGLFRVRP